MLSILDAAYLLMNFDKEHVSAFMMEGSNVGYFHVFYVSTVTPNDHKWLQDAWKH
jgi:hypothetical protein